MSETIDAAMLRAVTINIVAAYVAKNHLPANHLPGLIISVHGALAALTHCDTTPDVEKTEQPSPSQIRKSITPDALISFLDGRPYKTLKRHLRLRGLDANDYRGRFGLPVDYPMTAPNYSARRSELAKTLGLGRWRSVTERAK
ncbi:MucR family transcriptional regulator [Methylobacterium sp. J-067]|uniref:MucR family transcriptional regulator n=1 Tax=Methylobacterium sp. J-067 TaxID=2836648 RepID=UPI001FBB0E82|nr:MucR family transcriptional regulator [Methylobacterium sp. J-067]MCJ2024719.1 MucR family transcriptional regulator [Methylobacterium sp. J-067]